VSVEQEPAKPVLTAATRLRRTDEWLTTEIEGAVIMMHGASGRFVGLNETASHIWALLETPRTMAEIGDGLAAEFEIDSERARMEMAPLVAMLIENGAISCDRG